MKVRDVHCADSVTTHNILQNKKYFLKIKLLKAKVNIYLVLQT